MTMRAAGRPSASTVASVMAVALRRDALASASQASTSGRGSSGRGSGSGAASARLATLRRSISFADVRAPVRERAAVCGRMPAIIHEDPVDLVLPEARVEDAASDASLAHDQDRQAERHGDARLDLIPRGRQVLVIGCIILCV